MVYDYLNNHHGLSMELYQLRHFVAVLETASFTKGAERCAVSQPAISASVAKLEAEVGLQLLVRHKRNVAPTPAGRTLFETATNVLRACSAVKAQLKDRGRQSALRVGVVETLSAELVSGALKAFRRERPNIAIDLLDANEHGLSGRLQGSRLDAALTILHADERLPSKLKSKVLFSERYVAVVPRGHTLARRRTVRLNDLTGEPFISRTRCETFAATTRLFGTLGVRPRVVYRTDQDARALQLIGAGVGIALMPASYRSEDTVQLLIEDFPLKRTIGLQWRTETEKAELEDFVSFAASHPWPRRRLESRS